MDWQLEMAEEEEPKKTSASIAFQNINETYTPCLIKIQHDYLMFAEHKILPIIYSVGIVGNILIIVVSQLLKQKSVVNLLLKTLAVYDMMYLSFLFAESMAAMHSNVEIMEEPGWFWMLSSQEAFNGPDWKPPSLFEVPGHKCTDPFNISMYEKYAEFRQKYPVGCGTTVTNFIKHGLDYCEFTERMKSLYEIEKEEDLINTIHWILDVDIADKCDYNFNRMASKTYNDDKEIFCDQLKENSDVMTSQSNERSHCVMSTSLMEGLQAQETKLCNKTQNLTLNYGEETDVLIIDKLVEEQLKCHVNVNSSIVEAAELERVTLAIKRSWTKQHICFAHLLLNLTSFLDPMGNSRLMMMLRLQSHSIYRDIPERRKAFNDVKVNTMTENDHSCEQLLYSITAPAYDEIQQEIKEYQKYIESLVTDQGVMMLDWYIRHNLLFKDREDSSTSDARSIYHAVFATKIMARTFQFASACQTVVIALFRYVAICMPYSAPTFCSYRNGVIACVFSFVSSVLIHVPQYVLIANDYNTTANILGITEDANTNSSSSYSFDLFFSGYHVFFYNVIMFFALPFILLLFFNFRLVQELYRNSGRVGPNAARDNENREVTKTVIAVVLVYVITYVAMPIYIIDKWFFKNLCHLKLVKLHCLFFVGVNFIVWSFPSINSSVNFFIYCLFRSTFRKKVKEILSGIKFHLTCFCPCVKRTKRSIMLSDSTDSGKHS